MIWLHQNWNRLFGEPRVCLHRLVTRDLADLSTIHHISTIFAPQYVASTTRPESGKGLRWLPHPRYPGPRDDRESAYRSPRQHGWVY